MRVGKPKFVAADICSPERLSAMVHKFGHEVGNPLTSIISVATLLGRYAAQPEHLEAHIGKFPEYTAAVCREAWRIAALTERLVLIHSDRKGEAAPTSLRRSLARAHETVKKHPPFEESHLEWRGQDATAYVDADLLHYQLVALLENAFQATEVLPTDLRPLHVEAMASNL
ncbi:MAG: hypothetical protein IT290_00540, partial [Deltaproteobacteria bacterium]|nr:hypothetical protein [Deltaproteobacteria bacterium]